MWVLLRKYVCALLLYHETYARDLKVSMCSKYKMVNSLSFEILSFRREKMEMAYREKQMWFLAEIIP